MDDVIATWRGWIPRRGVWRDSLGRRAGRVAIGRWHSRGEVRGPECFVFFIYPARLSRPGGLYVLLLLLIFQQFLLDQLFQHLLDRSSPNLQDL